MPDSANADERDARQSRLKRWIAHSAVRRFLAVTLALAAVVAGVVTFLTLRGLPPFGGDPERVMLLLTLDLVLLLMLAVTVGWRVVAIWVERRRRSAGSHLHVRLVRLFGLVSVVPAIVVAVFSVLFFNFGIEAWLSDRVRTTLTESVAVAEAYLHEHKQNIRADVLAMANDLSPDATFLRDQRKLFDEALNLQSTLRELTEAVVFDRTGRVLARSGLTYVLEFEPIPASAMDAAQSGEVAILTSRSDDRVRALIRLDRLGEMFLYVGRFVDPQVLRHMERTRGGVERFERLEVRRAELQVNFALIYVVLAMLLLLSAAWIGVNFASQLSEPIGRLIGATERVRTGDLTARVPEEATEDEISSLSRAFNRMASDLERSRSELLDANSQIDERRRFTEAVLAGVSAGVIGLEEDGAIKLPNKSASELLAVELDRLIGHPLVEVVPALEPLLEEARSSRRGRPVEAQISYERGPETRSLLVRVGVERDDGAVSGFVVTFDDVTDLLSAQRKAAWADVARRIAHEIKNPLTPIQLSAERLKRKYLKEIGSDPETFVTCTDTIVRHVGDIGRMVDEFSSFARMPTPTMRPENLTDLCRQSVFLQRNAHPDIRFETDLPGAALFVNCDGHLLSQAVTNLLQNAVDAIGGREGEDLPQGVVKLALKAEEAEILIEVQDNGRGLPKEGRERLTEPYFTTRKKGTGLGLAIVKKIMEDHNGRLGIGDASGAGAVVTLHLPGQLRSDKSPGRTNPDGSGAEPDRGAAHG